MLRALSVLVLHLLLRTYSLRPCRLQRLFVSFKVCTNFDFWTFKVVTAAVTINRGAKQRIAGAWTTTSTAATREHKQYAIQGPAINLLSQLLNKRLCTHYVTHNACVQNMKWSEGDRTVFFSDAHMHVFHNGSHFDDPEVLDFVDEEGSGSAPLGEYPGDRPTLSADTDFLQEIQGVRPTFCRYFLVRKITVVCLLCASLLQTCMKMYVCLGWVSCC